MSPEIVERMKAEEADLLRKLQAVRDFLNAYGEEGGTPERPRSSGGSGPRPKAEIDAFTASTRTSVVLALQALAMTDQMMKTSELVHFIEAMGHTVNGENKVNALGALLSRSADVVGHGKSGWTVADRDKALAIVQKHAPKTIEAPSVSPLEASKSEEVDSDLLY